MPPPSFTRAAAYALAIVASFSANTQAASIPEDRADVLYHSYDGGGVSISGPSVLVRKAYKEKASVYANYYVDMVSSASIDVITQGSKYTEQRTETSAGLDYLHEKTTLSIGVINSSESDYKAKTAHVGASQSFFGDLTTLALGYAQGSDNVYQNVDGARQFRGEAKHRRFNLGITQVLSKNWILALTTESVVDDGFLRNPYRSYRRRADDGSIGLQQESYPETRNSDALALRSMYYLPHRASLRVEGRYYSDSWGIDGQHLELRYAQPFKTQYLFEVKVRGYSQSQADFYADMFDYVDSQAGQTGAEFRARDKELSEFSSVNLGFGVTYDLQKQWRSIHTQSISLFYDAMQFDYRNFKDARLSRGADAAYAPGQEPAYSLTANVIRLFYSAYY